MRSESVIRPANPERVQLRERNLTLKRALNEINGYNGRILEAGCGYGRFLRAIRQRWPNMEVHGCDLDPGAIEIARNLDNEIAYNLGSLTALPYANESFDIVLIFDVLEHLHEPQKGLAEIRRTMKPGGLLHALVPCEGQPFTLHWLLWRLNLAADLKERHGGHVQRFRHRDLHKLFNAYGLNITAITYSLHPVGQVKDILTYLAREEWFLRWHLNNPVYRMMMTLLWPAAYVESSLLSRIPASAVAMHITARKGTE